VETGRFSMVAANLSLKRCPKIRYDRRPTMQCPENPERQVRSPSKMGNYSILNPWVRRRKGTMLVCLVMSSQTTRIHLLKLWHPQTRARFTLIFLFYNGTWRWFELVQDKMCPSLCIIRHRRRILNLAQGCGGGGVRLAVVTWKAMCQVQCCRR